MARDCARRGTRLSSVPGRARGKAGECAVFYWFLKWIAIGPVLRVVFRPQVEGAENVPAEGPAILASNHLSYADWLFMPLTLSRRVTFVAKAEYFTSPGLKGWFQRKFFSGAGQVPIDRSGASAAEGALSSARRILDEGELFGIYPEGTRSHDGRLYRGKTGVARLALETKVPVIPVAVARHRRGRAARQEVRHADPALVRFGKPLDFSRYEGHGERPLHPAVDHRRDHVRDHAALRPGVRRHVRQPGQGGGQAARRPIPPPRPSRSRRPDPDAPLARRRPSPSRTACSGRSAVLRVVVLVNAVGLNLYRADNFDHPGRGRASSCLGMVAWTAFAIWAYADPARRAPAAAGRRPGGGAGRDPGLAARQGRRDFERHRSRGSG